MRVMIKGGVWKNTEDEILKAAVMKYGKNQWSRISSLLVRKSAKQCKARWYEWLDPSIKKTEWTREEDEKLLHLAKLMPTQWRTIAPIVGRTSAQCLERYEKLLDAACAKDENYDPGDDPRRLRPGEIDPNPESKPARPDPVDMDEDEKEMLNEARARLANTRGKKAKRKAREKQLEEAKRMASLQKRRELKAAGLDQARVHRKKRGIDYASEIPFEKKPAAGFYDASGETALAVSAEEFLGTKGRNVMEMDYGGKRRADIENSLKKADLSHTKVHERHDLPAHVQHTNDMNDTQFSHKRSKLLMPSPQVSERELEDLAKMGQAGVLAAAEAAAAVGSSGVTGTLLNDYATPRYGANTLRTPMRTPAAGGDSVLQEAENLYKLTQGQTPLLGGENPSLHASDFSGVTPKAKVAATPNPLRTPLHGGIEGGATPRGGGATPSTVGTMTPRGGTGRVGGGVPGTPMRDGLAINDPDSAAAAASSTAREAKERLRGQQGELRSGLGALPAPKNEYVAIMPEAEAWDEEDGAAPMDEEDMADVEKQQVARAAAAAAAELRKRSKALQRALPRPLGGEVAAEPHKDAALSAASALVAHEMRLLLAHDAANHPPAGAKKEKRKRDAEPLQSFDEAELVAAAAVLDVETAAVREEAGHSATALSEYMGVWQACNAEIIWLPSASSYGRGQNATTEDRLGSVKGDFERAKGDMEKDAKRASKVEQKVQVLTSGLAARAVKEGARAVVAHEEAAAAALTRACYQALQVRERTAAAARVRALKADVEAQREKEKGLQYQFEVLQQARENNVVSA